MRPEWVVEPRRVIQTDCAATFLMESGGQHRRAQCTDSVPGPRSQPDGPLVNVEAKMTTLTLILAVIGLLCLSRAIKKLSPRPSPPIVARFLDSALRRRWLPPSQVVERSGIKPGMTVLDLGCASGAMTTSIARAVGSRGSVHALDIQPAMLQRLERKLARPENQDITNVRPLLGSANDLRFEGGSLDAAVMICVFQEIADKDGALREILRVLKPGGILAVTESLLDRDYALRATTIKQCRRGGFVLDGGVGNFRTYTVRFVKPTSRASARTSKVPAAPTPEGAFTEAA